MLNTKRISEMQNMKVFDDTGNYFGDIEEAIITLNKVFGWRVRATRASALSRLLGGAKGVIVPHNFVKAIGDVVIINKANIPSFTADEPESAEG